MGVNVKDFNIARASDIYQIDYELLAYITEKQPDYNFKLIISRVNAIYSKYYKSIKDFDNNTNFNILMHLNLLCTIIPNFQLEEGSIIGEYNGLRVNMFFGEEIIIKINYLGISRHVRFFVNQDVAQLSFKIDNNVYDPELERIYHNFAYQYHALDAFDSYTYKNGEIIFFSRYKTENDLNGNIIDDYNYDTALIAQEEAIDESGNKSKINYYKVKFCEGNTVNGDYVKRPPYAIVIENVPDEMDRDIFDLDYFEVDQDEYDDTSDVSNYIGKKDSNLEKVNRLLLKHSKLTINIEKM